MSRRKQSNPKPLKREDEEWGKEGETMTTETPGSPPMPRLRLNTSLATDPARGSANSNNSGAPTPTPPPPSAATGSEYISNLPQALQTALVAGLFPLAFPVDSQTSTTPAPRPPSVPLDLPPRQLSVPLYMCTPCGIRFSSLSTLEAHQTYYCSHRTPKPDEEGKTSTGDGSNAGAQSQDDSSTDGSNKIQKTGKQYTCTHCSYSADKKVSLNRHMRMHSVSPSPPSLPGSTTSNGDVNPDLSSPPAQMIPDRYCADCDIRFSSTKTFRAHKLHYCSTRQVVKSTPNSAPSVVSTPAPKSGSSCTSGSAPPSPNDACKSPPSPSPASNGPQPLVALPTNPILIVPYSLYRGASVLAGSTVIPSADTPCFLMPNGTIQSMSQAFSVMNRPSLPNTPTEVLKSANKPREAVSNKDSPIPLDLSVRRSPEIKSNLSAEIDEQEKENRLQQSMTPEQIVCAPSLPGSPPLTPSPKQGSSPNSSASPKRKYQESRSSSPKQNNLTPKSNSDDSIQLSPKSKTPIILANSVMPFPVPAGLHSLLLRSGNSILPQDIAMRLVSELPGVQNSPQVLVKQGVSKCKECNIVFCKYENYLAHKKHYCSARGNVDESDGSKSTTSPPISPNNNSTGKTSPVAQYQQLICAACGIKFTSLDNLTAHQSYYCLKRPEIQLNNVETDVRKCPKCKGAMEAGHVCANVVGAEGGGWRCPCCGAVSATASAAQRHLDSHGGVRAFRCTICGYKGNTLRGMRTHIRMHFPKRAADLQEENFITCILEEDNNRNAPEINNVVPSAQVLVPPPAPSPAADNRSDRLHYCDTCNYSSTYKGNVVRHTRLLHSGSGVKSTEQSLIGEGDESLVLNGNDAHKTQEDDEPRPHVIVKQEVQDMDVDVTNTEEDLKTNIVDKIKQEITNDVQEGDMDTDVLEAKLETKYCKSCDISFKYMSTFMAHKKFYCTRVTTESVTTPSNNNIAARATEASVL